MKTPILKRHKATNQAYVWQEGRRLYFGKWGEEKTLEKYRRFLYEKGQPEPDQDLTVADLFALFLTVYKDYYTKNGKQTGGLNVYKRAAEFAVGLYGTLPARQYTARYLLTTRDAILGSGRFCRAGVNSIVSAVRHVFKFAVSREIVPPEILTSLQSVPPLLRGRTTARETMPIKPVDRATVMTTLKYCQPTIRAMIQLQLLTGMRACEVTRIRPIDLDRAGDVLVYTLTTDKTDYRRSVNNRRKIFLGERAEKILTPFLLTAESPTEYLFSPQAAYMEAVLVRKKGRGVKKPLKKFNDYYTTDAYRKAIYNACARAGVMKWSPHKLRHLYATEIRSKYGLEVAQVMLGHARADVTQIYAERDETRARNIAKAEG